MSIAALLLALAQANAPWISDQGNGRYQNPVLAGDYSDLDVIRVGDTYYLTASSFTNVPGLPILTSKDLVNWTIIAHALPRNLPDAHYLVPRRGAGVWAPAIRHHDGRFKIYYPDPDHGIFVVTASDPSGPWSDPILVDDTKGAIDPAPFWDDDGTGWLIKAFAGSRAGFNNVLELRRLDSSGMKAVGQPIRVVDGNSLPPAMTSRGPMPWFTLEGPKLYKRDGWYYIFAPAASVKGGWQGVLRSRSITGPYEGRNVMDQGPTDINGPHQGAWVTDIAGKDWFMHFQDTDAYGRRAFLEPMRWRPDGWPVIGIDPDGDGIGQPVTTYRKPTARTAQAITRPRDSDDFGGPALGPQWQWNANPQPDWASLSAAPGSLRLKAISSPVNLWNTGAMLTQKLPGPRFTVTTQLSFAAQAIGERAGLVMFGRNYGWIGLEKTAAGLRLVRTTRENADHDGPEHVEVILAAAPASVWLRLTAEPVTQPAPPPEFSPYWPSMLRNQNAAVQFSYSLDGMRFEPVGKGFIARQGQWVGAQMGLFAQAPSGTPAYSAYRVGWADFSSFDVTR
jgi:beta-xylosidase